MTVGVRLQPNSNIHSGMHFSCHVLCCVQHTHCTLRGRSAAMRHIAPRIYLRSSNSYLRWRASFLQSLARRTSSTPATRLGQRTLATSSDTSDAGSPSKFSAPTEAASVPFPGTDLRVSRVGFGSPWIGAAPDRALNMSGYVLCTRVWPTLNKNNGSIDS